MISVLGAGGMATVYQGYDTRLGVFRAIKVLASNLAARPSIRNRFENEAMTMARLRHPNIVMVHDVDSEMDRVYMVMEMLQGGSLFDLGERTGRVPPRLAVSLLRQSLQGLVVAHEAGVVHRDIKPENILLNREGVPKITDFGIARAPDSKRAETRTGAVMGTWLYMAPEQRESATNADARSDLYAIGMSLFSLVMDEEAFEIDARDAALQRLGRVAPSLRPIVERATHADPAERPQTARLMADELAELELELAECPPVHQYLAPVAPPVLPSDTKSTPVNNTLMPASSGSDTYVPEPTPAGTLAADVDFVSGKRSRWPIVAGFGVLLMGVGTCAGVVALSQLSDWATPASADAVTAVPIPSEPVPDVAAPDPDRVLVEPSVPAPVPEVAAPDIAPEPAVAPEPMVVSAPAPEPVAPLPVAPSPQPQPDPPTPVPQAVVEPVTVVPVVPSTGTVVVSGAPAGVYLQAGSRRESPGAVPPGVYDVRVPGEPDSFGRVTVALGQTVQLRCDAMLRMCRE